jgi:hypothetical protein
MWHGVEPTSQVRVPYVRGLLRLERAHITISREDPRMITTYLGYIVQWRGLLDDETEGLPLLEQTSDRMIPYQASMMPGRRGGSSSSDTVKEMHA